MVLGCFAGVATLPNHFSRFGEGKHVKAAMPLALRCNVATVLERHAHEGGLSCSLSILRIAMGVIRLLPASQFDHLE